MIKIALFLLWLTHVTVTDGFASRRVMSTRGLLAGNILPPSCRTSPLFSAKSGTEIGIQTVQLLMDKRRHGKLRQDLSRQFPLIPEAVVESCVDVVAGAFAMVAPSQLQQALKPGGMDKVGPELSKSIATVVLKQPVIRAIPVHDKRQLVETLVNMALGYASRDAKLLFSAPEVRLEALEEEIKQVQQMMGSWRLLLYRVRRLPRAVKIGSLAAAGFAFVYQQQGTCDLVAFQKVGKATYFKLALVSSWIFKAGKAAHFKLAVVFSWIGKQASSLLAR